MIVAVVPVAVNGKLAIVAFPPLSFLKSLINVSVEYDAHASAVNASSSPTDTDIVLIRPPSFPQSPLAPATAIDTVAVTRYVWVSLALMSTSLTINGDEPPLNDPFRPTPGASTAVTVTAPTVTLPPKSNVSLRSYSAGPSPSLITSSR